MSAAVVTTSVQVKRSGYARAVRSEWIKTSSLRSTWILVVLAVGSLVGFPVLVGPDWIDFAGGSGAESVDAVSLLWIGVDFALTLVAVLAALLATVEFTTGMARNTFTATPTRGAVLGAKATVGGLFALGVGLVGFVGAWVASLGTFGDAGVSIDLTDGATLRLVAVQLLALVVTAELAIALGVLLRSSVGAIFTIVAMQLILPGVLSLVNSDIARWVSAVLPVRATSAAALTEGPADGVIGLGPNAGVAVLVAWAVVPMLGALVSLRKRDV